jgi:hypothetical protein
MTYLDAVPQLCYDDLLELEVTVATSLSSVL